MNIYNKSSIQKIFDNQIEDKMTKLNQEKQEDFELAQQLGNVAAQSLKKETFSKKDLDR